MVTRKSCTECDQATRPPQVTETPVYLRAGGGGGDWSMTASQDDDFQPEKAVTRRWVKKEPRRASGGRAGMHMM
jgi:hypothetical protein